MAAASSAPVGLLLLLLVSVETRPSPQNNEQQVFLSLFGSRLASLIEATPPPDDITEGSASSPTSPPLLLALSRHGNVSGLAGRQEVVPRLFLDFLRRRAKTRRRSHKATAGGRGCFGMKLDRIGSISGLGC
ncbi:C-type natriuretic peptide 2-like [Xiphophorus maculatus]|uniref:C-type natriuretic peptide 2-like n=1 Tax=Xiphophorus maculatus TaxID=8083 RepID=A0A3B5QFX0_XIPMA|nr:C-type natriuretic peptide 2-like [Xiphophorus maculatus]XP_023201862.1 C-type natriuretic peptide 2-like [Xiphophorus maculatus]